VRSSARFGTFLRFSGRVLIPEQNAASQLLTRTERAAIRAPIEKAQTLPRRAFIDDEFFRCEAQLALKQSWLAGGFASLIPDAGDISPLTVLGQPILLVHDHLGTAREFHNVTPYDGYEVAVAPAQGLVTIVTPYHRWRYRLDGTLVKARDGHRC
jgi:phenylpropionate dioxygenase-like ring-hydroxylating dioxygenase large terminal subunit